MRAVGGSLRWFGLITLACAVMLVAAGGVFAALTGKGAQGSVAAALFIGAAFLIAVNALGESGSRDRGVDVRTGTTYPGAGTVAGGSFGWVLVGFVLIGLGVLILVV